MIARIQIRRDTSSNWYENNPVLYPGEIGFEVDTLKFKVGPLTEIPDTGTNWNDISNYANLVPSNSNQTSSDFITFSDLNTASGPAQLDGNRDLLIPNDSIIFEGSIEDSYKTKLSVINPTSNNTIYVPDNSGTMALKSDVIAYLDTFEITTNNSTDIDSRLLNSFTTGEYTISVKQGSKIRSSKVILQTNGTLLDMTEFGIIETGGAIQDISISSSIVASYAKLNIIISNAEDINATVKIIKNIV